MIFQVRATKIKFNLRNIINYSLQCLSGSLVSKKISNATGALNGVFDCIGMML
jgi:hypothetical protein